MDTHIEQWTTASHFFVDEPATFTRNTISSHPACLRVIDTPKATRFDVAFEYLHIAAGPLVEDHLQNAVGLDRCPRNLLGLCSCASQGLFA